MHKFVNSNLTNVGLKSIPPQMIYNYISKGYIKSVEVDGKRFVEEEEVQNWTNKYLEKRVLRKGGKDLRK